MEAINVYLFNALNARAALNSSCLLISVFLAEYLIWLVPVS